MIAQDILEPLGDLDQIWKKKKKKEYFTVFSFLHETVIQFILWSEWLLLNPLFNGVFLFHINGRSLILLYYVAVTLGIWHSSLKCRFSLSNWKTV